MTLHEIAVLHDVQARPDDRGVALDEVGVRGLRYPLTVQEPDGTSQQTIADISMSVNLSPEVKGAHLSRFLEAMIDSGRELSIRSGYVLVAELTDRLEASAAAIEFRFPYFLERIAPVSGARALMDYQVGLRVETSVDDGERCWVQVDVPIATVCPCSKEISDYGAHNQRGTAVIRVRPVREAGADNPLSAWVRDLIEVGEAGASSPLYPLLKRPDERYVTMQGYENPVFVEDVVRQAVCALKADPRVAWYSVEASTDESIHNHAAYAAVYSDNQSIGGVR